MRVSRHLKPSTKPQALLPTYPFSWSVSRPQDCKRGEATALFLSPMACSAPSAATALLSSNPRAFAYKSQSPVASFPKSLSPQTLIKPSSFNPLRKPFQSPAPRSISSRGSHARRDLVVKAVSIFHGSLGFIFTGSAGFLTLTSMRFCRMHSGLLPFVPKYQLC